MSVSTKETVYNRVILSWAPDRYNKELLKKNTFYIQIAQVTESFLMSTSVIPCPDEEGEKQQKSQLGIAACICVDKEHSGRRR